MESLCSGQWVEAVVEGVQAGHPLGEMGLPVSRWGSGWWARYRLGRTGKYVTNYKALEYVN